MGIKSNKKKEKSIISNKNITPISENIKLQQIKSKKEIIETLITNDNSFPLESYVLNNSGVIVNPNRGGTLPSLILDGVEIFYNNPERRNDPKQSLREGYWMGPQAGPFSPEQNNEYGFDLKQHGFLRDVSRKKERFIGEKIKYQFESDENTFKKFPYSFKVYQNIIMGIKGARISLSIKNKGKNDMKFAPGHHTYYKISPDQKENIKLSDNMGVDETMKSKWISGTETIKIQNPGSCQIFIPGTGLLQLNFDPQFKHLRLRSENGAGFICIEPVVCHPSKWDTSSINIKPNEEINVGFTITLISKDN